MAEAIRIIRETMGEDAAIFSQRKIPEGVEVTAVMDYDPDKLFQVQKSVNNAPILSNTKQKHTSAPPQLIDDTEQFHKIQQEIFALKSLLENQLAGLSWDKAQRQSPVGTLVFRKLKRLGLKSTICRELEKEIKEECDVETAWKFTLNRLAQSIRVDSENLSKMSGTYVLVGPTGVGKTTTITKLAAKCAIMHGADSVAILTSDVYRVGGADQLKTYAKVLGITIKTFDTQEMLLNSLKALKDKRLILIDTAGMSFEDPKLSQQLSLFDSRFADFKTLLVLPATNQTQASAQAYSAFKSAKIDGLVITKLDECVNLGSSLNILLENAIPLALVTNGQKIPEDLYFPSSMELINKVVEISSKYGQSSENGLLAMEYSGQLVDTDV